MSALVAVTQQPRYGAVIRGPVHWLPVGRPRGCEVMGGAVNPGLLRPLGRLSLVVFLHLLLLPDRLTSACDAGGAADTLLLCRTCGHELAFESDIRHFPSPLSLSDRNDTLVGDRRVHVQLFENPQGHRFEVITFRKADVTRRLPADRRFSWFPGYSWMVATCPRCKTHLGWAFQPSDWPDIMSEAELGESENTFVALIIHRLLREEFTSSLLMIPKSFTS